MSASFSARLSLDEYNFYNANNYEFFYANNQSLQNEVIDLVFDIGQENIVITDIEISGNSELISYLWYYGITYQEGTGTNQDVIQMNELTQNKSSTTLILNPNITDFGTSQFPFAIDIIAQQGAESQVLLNKKIITHKRSIKKNTVQLLRVLNRTYRSAANVEIRFYYTII